MSTDKKNDRKKHEKEDSVYIPDTTEKKEGTTSAFSAVTTSEDKANLQADAEKGANE